eukprot:Hpha_TRINITY_DN13019_c0_g1::TRINITY_DN13019_c0_g1_i2::g.68790::m.68790
MPVCESFVNLVQGRESTPPTKWVTNVTEQRVYEQERGVEREGGGDGGPSPCRIFPLPPSAGVTVLRKDSQGGKGAGHSPPPFAGVSKWMELLLFKEERS